MIQQILAFITLGFAIFFLFKKFFFKKVKSKNCNEEDCNCH